MKHTSTLALLVSTCLSTTACANEVGEDMELNAAFEVACTGGWAAAGVGARQWAGQILEPPATPFAIRSARYTLLPAFDGAPFCDVDVPHRVFIGVLDDETPPSDFAGLRELDGGPQVTVDGLPVSPDLVVEEGQRIFLAVEMVADGASESDPANCLEVCVADVAAINRSFISSPDMPPVSWDRLIDDGFGSSAWRFDVFGVVVE
ncbi:MAG: hypothetical protein ACFCGT_03510 [Sandaracinaceae bacterium]